MKLHSPRSILVLGALLAAGSGPGCADPEGAFNEFVDRIPDASTDQADAAPVGALPDVSGTSLVAVQISIAPDRPLQFLATNRLTINPDDTGVLDMSFTALDAETRTPIGDTISVDGIEVNNAGEFTISVGVLTVPGEANPISGSMALARDLALHGRIMSADVYCGDVTGQLEQPITIDLQNSKFASIRVDDGVVGDALPPPMSACP